MQKFKDVSAQSYAQMPGLDWQLVRLKLNIRRNQAGKTGIEKFQANAQRKIKQKKQKLLDIGFIKLM